MGNKLFIFVLKFMNISDCLLSEISSESKGFHRLGEFLIGEEKDKFAKTQAKLELLTFDQKEVSFVKLMQLIN